MTHLGEPTGRGGERRRRRVADGTLLVLALLGASPAVVGPRSPGDPRAVRRGVPRALSALRFAWLGATRLRGGGVEGA